MRKIISTVCVMAIATTLSFSQNLIDNQQQVIATAKAAIKSTCPDAKGNLEADVQLAGPCIGGGASYVVTFTRLPNCPPNQPCIAVIIPIGSVTIDCDGNATSVTCGPPIISQ